MQLRFKLAARRWIIPRQESRLGYERLAGIPRVDVQHEHHAFELEIRLLVALDLPAIATQGRQSPQRMPQQIMMPTRENCRVATVDLTGRCPAQPSLAQPSLAQPSLA